MKRLLTTGCIVGLATLALPTTVRAEHDLRREIRDSYHRELKELDRRYDRNRLRLTHAYQRERDAIQELRRRVSRQHHCEAKTVRLRHLNDELADLSREYARRRRALSDAERAEREVLRDRFEFALQQARHGGYIAARHAANCGCSTCSDPPVHAYERFGRQGEFERYGRHDERRRGEFDWAGLVLNLLSRRLSR